MSNCYAILPYPHPNARYQEAQAPLALAELRLCLRWLGMEGSAEYVKMGALSLLRFEAGELSEIAARELMRLSFCLALFKVKGNSLLPLDGGACWAFPQDLPAVLKYKGKTNETFTRFMINAARYSRSAGEDADCLLDPLCGRGTSLFCALERGMDAIGIDADKEDIRQLNQYFERYLKYHRLKHSASRSSLTVEGKARGELTTFEFTSADGRKGKLRALKGDAANLRRFFPRERFPLAVMDMPYGVQHSGEGGGKRPDELARRLLPPLYEAMPKGGAAAIAFNTNTLKLDALRNIAADCGFEPLRGENYDDLAHFVETAVTRDVIVIRK